ncbi:MULTISPECIES: hypothetical protein [unclassified Sphingomonas]|uniref:hypothetical protein n=1 Tax=unclassified Sphingomonas TaxID=196159 RepID=UPI0012E19C1F|nr:MULTISPECIES: hypothetical protein [unclassified Sphingomonas]
MPKVTMVRFGIVKIAPVKIIAMKANQAGKPISIVVRCNQRGSASQFVRYNHMREVYAD